MSEFGDKPRRRIPSGTTFYVRSDGADGNDGLSDSPDCAFRTWQAAVACAQEFDLGNGTLTIQAGDEPGDCTTYADPILIGPMVGGGRLLLRGQPGSGRTIISTGHNVCIKASNVGTTDVEIQDMTLTNVGGNGLIEAQYLTRVFVGSGVRFGAAGFSHLNVHDSQAMILILNSGYEIIGGAGSSHMFINGGWVFWERSHVTLTGVPHFPGGFVKIVDRGHIQANTISFAGGATGQQYNITNGSFHNWSGVIVLPGSGDGACAEGGRYY